MKKVSRRVSRKRRELAALAASLLVLGAAGVATSVFAAEPMAEQARPTGTLPAPAPVVLTVPTADVPPQPPWTPEPVTPAPVPAVTPKVATAPQYVKDPLSLTMIVNKKRQLHAEFAPADLRTVNVPRIADEALRSEAATALEKLFAAATSQGVTLVMNSAYRSYATQELLYGRIAAAQGKAAADASSARPGFSEHQSGLAADVAQGPGTSSSTAVAWIASHAHEYGFIVRYLKGKEAITGYQYESWHIRYVGTPISTTLTVNGTTMEEHFHVEGGGYAN